MPLNEVQRSFVLKFVDGTGKLREQLAERRAELDALPKGIVGGAHPELEATLKRTGRVDDPASAKPREQLKEEHLQDVLLRDEDGLNAAQIADKVFPVNKATRDLARRPIEKTTPPADKLAIENARAAMVQARAALFIFTPRGRNHGYRTWLQALEAETWFSERLTVDETGLITAAQIEGERQAGMSEAQIRQEFFCSFEAENDEQLIPTDLVEGAMAREVVAQGHEKVIGVDVARFGEDRSVIWFRQGRDGHPIPCECFIGVDTMQLASPVAAWIQRWCPDGVFVDDGGVGGGVVDRLHQLGFHEVRGVNFGGRSDCPRTGEKAGNKRTEMWLSAAPGWMHRG